eukprot:Cvel_25030.t1-p1 / transcript=Cvel_25030.t1 / gene=Cvel_25030 / organism=Chromera_velia_CCMP2878 / gene_product=hypothetical protein / transcript_product=hypothetical protein / location=Cvel_scaffold2777:16873-23770(+) / protein_length=328 / sequence_SO=supercontig / SO=protein_coding / is_pseudo=false
MVAPSKTRFLGPRAAPRTRRPASVFVSQSPKDRRKEKQVTQAYSYVSILACLSVKEMSSWKQVAMIAGSAAAAGALMWLLLREEPAEAGDGAGAGSKKLTVDNCTKEQVLSILKEIISSQEKIKELMKNLSTELRQGKLGFDETYERVTKAQPEDPLEKYGLSMGDFDALLDRHQHDPEIRTCIGTIMGPPPSLSNLQGKVQSVTAATIVEVHKFMLEELRKLVTDFKNDRQKKRGSQYDMKTVTIAAQAIVGAKVEEKFQLSTEQVEAAVILNSEALQRDAEFARLNMEMQQVRDGGTDGDTGGDVMRCDGMGGRVEAVWNSSFSAI